MNEEQLFSGIPLAGIAIVLFAFALSTWWRAEQRRERYWPLSWGALSALFLLWLSIVAATGAFRVFSTTAPDIYELWAVRAALWVAFAVSVWTFGRWLRDGREE